MNTINFETSINAPKEKVWEILADFSGRKMSLSYSSLMGLKRYAETGQRIEADDLHHMTGTTHN